MNSSESSILDELIKALLEFDIARMKKLATTALTKKIPPFIIIEEGIAKGLQEIGRQYEAGQLFVTHLVAAAEASRSTIDDILKPALAKQIGEPAEAIKERMIRPKVILATVEGDIHDIGKNIVGAMLFAAGFEVIDLGRDVPSEKIVAAIREHKPSILGLSSLLSTTKTQMAQVLKSLEREELRKTVKVMVGGGSVTAEWARDIGADGYGANATEAVTLAKDLLNIN